MSTHSSIGSDHPTYIEPIRPLTAFGPDDDIRAHQTREWRRGWDAGWRAAHSWDNMREAHAGSRLNERRLTYAFAEATAALSQGVHAPPMPVLAPSGLVGACPEPPASLPLRWWLGWEYAHAAGITELIDALPRAATDQDAAETVEDHLGAMPRRPDRDWVDVRARVRFAAYAVRAWWAAEQHPSRADKALPTPANVTERFRVLTAAGAERHAARFRKALAILVGAERYSRWKVADGIDDLPSGYLQDLDRTSVEWTTST